MHLRKFITRSKLWLITMQGTGGNRDRIPRSWARGGVAKKLVPINTGAIPRRSRFCPRHERRIYERPNPYVPHPNFYAGLFTTRCEELNGRFLAGPSRFDLNDWLTGDLGKISTRSDVKTLLRDKHSTSVSSQHNLPKLVRLRY